MISPTILSHPNVLPHPTWPSAIMPLTPQVPHEHIKPAEIYSFKHTISTKTWKITTSMCFCWAHEDELLFLGYKILVMSAKWIRKLTLLLSSDYPDFCSPHMVVINCIKYRYVSMPMGQGVGDKLNLSKPPVPTDPKEYASSIFIIFATECWLSFQRHRWLEISLWKGTMLTVYFYFFILIDLTPNNFGCLTI